MKSFKEHLTEQKIKTFDDIKDFDKYVKSLEKRLKRNVYGIESGEIKKFSDRFGAVFKVPEHKSVDSVSIWYFHPDDKNSEPLIDVRIDTNRKTITLPKSFTNENELVKAITNAFLSG